MLVLVAENPRRRPRLFRWNLHRATAQRGRCRFLDVEKVGWTDRDVEAVPAVFGTAIECAGVFL